MKLLSRLPAWLLSAKSFSAKNFWPLLIIIIMLAGFSALHAQLQQISLLLKQAHYKEIRRAQQSIPYPDMP